MNKKIWYLIAVMFIMSVLANVAHPVTPELVVNLNMSSLMYGIIVSGVVFIISYVLILSKDKQLDG